MIPPSEPSAYLCRDGRLAVALGAGRWLMVDHCGVITMATDRPAEARRLAPTEAVYPDTRFLALCTLDGRKSGRVTVGESRLPAHMVLAVIRAHGVQEATIQWPQLTSEELAVMAQLAADLDMEDDGA